MISVPSARRSIPAARMIELAHSRVMPSIRREFDLMIATAMVARDSGTVTNTAINPVQIVRSIVGSYSGLRTRDSALLELRSTANKELEGVRQSDSDGGARRSKRGR